MMLLQTVLEVHCMMCGTEVGEIVADKFVHHQGCARKPVVRGGFLRCCRCDGSLFLEPVSATLPGHRGYAAARPDLGRAAG